jgi:hypothetical protein
MFLPSWLEIFLRNVTNGYYPFSAFFVLFIIIFLLACWKYLDSSYTVLSAYVTDRVFSLTVNRSVVRL